MKFNINYYLLAAISFLFVFTNIYSQNDYYSGTENLYGEVLKSTLHSKIRGHVRFPYSSTSRDVWDLLKETDRDPNNSSNVILLYTDYSVNAAQEYNNGNGWNREHVWAKSHGFPNSDDTAYTDVHHLRPSDISTNSTRGDLDFDYGGTATTDKDVHYDSNSWEPRDEIKGDIARMMLYMTVRYEGGDGYDLELVETIPSSGSTFGKKSVLLEWNRLDPVSEFERNRNRVIYKYQKNFNPFVDHPEFADRIYNSDKLIIEKAEQVNSNELVLTFSKELNSTEAEKSNNYELDRLGTPVLATSNFAGDAKKVLLSFNVDFVDTFYNVRVTNLLSTSGEGIIPNSIAIFNADAAQVVDTTAPSAPQGITVTQEGGDALLTWMKNKEPDISHYAIYKGALPNFTPSEYTLLTTTTDTLFLDENVPDYRVYYKISAFDNSGNESEYSSEVSIIVDVKNEESLPLNFSLSQNYPNPFNPTTTINYQIEEKSFVTLKIYDILGNEVKTLIQNEQTAGEYSIGFNASALTSGLYFYKLIAGKYSSTKKMSLVK